MLKYMIINPQDYKDEHDVVLVFDLRYFRIFVSWTTASPSPSCSLGRSHMILYNIQNLATLDPTMIETTIELKFDTKTKRSPQPCPFLSPGEKCLAFRLGKLMFR